MNTSKEESVGQRLRRLRKSRRWSQKDLADQITASVPSIHRWENDEGIPSPYNQVELAEVFGLTVEELFTLQMEDEEDEIILSQGEQVTSTIWNVPQLRNLYFTGREEILTQLHDNFSSRKPIALTQPYAISGLGGIGKTQVAIEYAYRYGHEYKAVLWVQSDSQELLISEMAQLAPLLNLPEKQQKDQIKVVEAVQRWLQSNTEWLLIVDNADDIRMALEFLPTRRTGHILLTTRSRPTGNKLIGIEVEKMRREEGVLFLLRRAKIIAEDATIDRLSETQRKDADTLYDLLDGLPLALDQAASYMEELGSSLQEYIDLYKTRYNDLWKRRGEFSKKDYPKPVATTWSLNFESVEQNNPAAAELLRLCAFLHPDAIPEELIMSGAAELGSILQDMAVDSIRLDKAIGELSKYSLVKRNPETKTLTIHRLVQAVLKESMNELTRRVWAERTTRAIDLAFPDEEDVSLWEQCERFLPHALICTRLIKDYSFEFAEVLLLLHKTAIYLDARAQYTQAEQLLIQALTIGEQHLGSEHPDMMAPILGNLAMLYIATGKYEQAEQLLIQALAIGEQHFGSEHPDMAPILSNLARLYIATDKYEQAEQLLIQALAIGEQHFGLEHPDMITIRENLIGLLKKMGRTSEAEEQEKLIKRI